MSDPLLRFWYPFIYPNQERLKINGDLVYENLQDKIHQFIRFGFEDVARLYMDYLNAHGELGDVYEPFKAYRVDKSTLNRSTEIDGLSDNGKTLILFECKYRNLPFIEEMLEHLKESASIFPSKLKRVYYLFSKNDFAIQRKEDNVHLIRLEDMFDVE